jgi:hypothetical protein
VCFKRHDDGRWGLEQQTWADGRRDYWRPLTEDDKPWPLRGLSHGTQVILHGTTAGEDTPRAPRSVSEARAHWISRYLNGRFLRLPEQVEVLVREDHTGQADWRNPGPLRRIQGQQHHLEQRALHAGRELGDPTGLARSTALLGLSLAAEGDLDRGRDLVDEALAINLSQDDRWGEGHCNLYLGIISDLESDPERASLHYRAAVDAFLPSRDATLLPVALVGHAGTLVRRDPARALQVAAAAASMRARVGSQYALFYAARADEVRAEAEARVGEAAERLWSTGLGSGSQPP